MFKLYILYFAFFVSLLGCSSHGTTVGKYADRRYYPLESTTVSAAMSDDSYFGFKSVNGPDNGILLVWNYLNGKDAREAMRPLTESIIKISDDSKFRVLSPMAEYTIDLNSSNLNLGQAEFASQFFYPVYINNILAAGVLVPTDARGKRIKNMWPIASLADRSILYALPNIIKENGLEENRYEVRYLIFHGFRMGSSAIWLHSDNSTNDLLYYLGPGDDALRSGKLYSAAEFIVIYRSLSGQ